MKKFLIIIILLLMLCFSLFIDNKNENKLELRQIDESLMEKLYDTEKIIVKDMDSFQILREINDYRVIFELVKIIRNSNKITKNNSNFCGYTNILEMYNEDNELLETIYLFIDEESKIYNISINKCEYYKVFLDKVSFKDLIEGNIVRRDFDNLNELVGLELSIKENSLTRSGVSILVNDKTNKDIKYSSYRIDKFVDDEWVSLDFSYENYYNSVISNISWKNIYGKLDDGDYRLVMSFYSEEDNCNYYMSLEFSI